MFRRIILSALGIISLGLGVAGMFLPVLPTTPFLLLSSALFLRSSKRLYNWLMNHPRFGPYISDFLIHKAIPLRVKIVSISMLWMSLLCCAIFVSEKMIMRIVFILIAIGVTIHILSFKTKRKDGHSL